MTELGNAEVGCQRCLFAFLTDYAYPNFSCLDHANVVATVTNTTNALLGMFADEQGNFGLL